MNMRFRFPNIKMKRKNTREEGIGVTDKGIVTLTRQQLYDAVWKQSAAKVAKQYNLHYGRFINSLKLANIPYPPSGYWTRVDCGKDVSSELVPLSGDGEEEVQLALVESVTRRKKQTFEVISEDASDGDNEKQLTEVLTSMVAGSKTPEALPNSAILEIPDEVLSFLPNNERASVIETINSLEIKHNAQLHKKLIAYKVSIKEFKDFLKGHNLPENSKNYYDRGRTIEAPQFINDVSDDSLNRIIMITDVLLKTVEKLGGSVENDLSVKIRQDIVHFKFIEAQDKVPHEITKQEAKELLKYKDSKRFGGYVYEPKIRKYDNVYNGKLRVVFDDSSYIRDSVELKLESRLDEILIRLYEISEIHKIHREKREKEHRLYLEAQRREEDLKERKKLEAKKTQALANMSKDYQTACEIRNYIAAVINKGELTEADFQWVEWATKKADWYDPIVAKEDEYLGKREHSCDDEDKALISKMQGRVNGWW